VYVDSHAHIHDKAFDEDRDQVIERMRAASVESAVLVGCDLADSRRALETARRYGFKSSAGIHPHAAKDAPADLKAAFLQFTSDPLVVAIGETGLDYYYDHSPREDQQRVLRSQIRLARAIGYPVIFHHRDAFDDFVAILREEWNAGMTGVIHCFTGDGAQAEIYTREFGLYLGIGGVVTFKTAQPVRDAIRSVGVDRLLLETDCPYLAPVPHRGKRNEPAFIPDIAERVAGELGITRERLADVSSGNARTIFKL
jgi:TatD DNase family protein